MLGHVAENRREGGMLRALESLQIACPPDRLRAAARFARDCWLRRSPGSAAASNGAQERTRTSTPLRAPAPEAGASTNSATWALRRFWQAAALKGRRPALSI